MHVVSVFSHYLFSALLIAKMTEIFYHLICYRDYTLRQAQNDRRSIISTLANSNRAGDADLLSSP